MYAAPPFKKAKFAGYISEIEKIKILQIFILDFIKKELITLGPILLEQISNY